MKDKQSKQRYGIIVIGAGGTGSLFLGDFCRFLSTSDAARDSVADIIIVDGDTVEEKNLSRQCFFAEDIGSNKADAMAASLGEAFGITIASYGRYIETPEEIMGLVEKTKAICRDKEGYRYNEALFVPVIISCVDNVHCRLQMEEAFRRLPTCYYIDSGNGFRDGQAVYALKKDGAVLSPMRDWYGADYTEEDRRSRTEMSCEELNRVAPQHILTNRMAALNITRAMIILCESGYFMRGYTSFDAFLGNGSSKTPEEFGFIAPSKKKRSTRTRKKVS